MEHGVDAAHCSRFYLIACEIAETQWFRRFGIEMIEARLQGLVLALVLGSLLLSRSVPRRMDELLAVARRSTSESSCHRYPRTRICGLQLSRKWE